MESISSFQRYRIGFKPRIPLVLQNLKTAIPINYALTNQKPMDPALKELFPNTYALPFITV